MAGIMIEEMRRFNNLLGEIDAAYHEANQRLDKFLGKLLNEAPKGFYYKMLRKKNIKLNDSKVKAIKGDVFTAYCGFEDNYFDLIVSNPPYIKSDDIRTLQTEVQQEPRLALDGGKSGYDFYEAIIKNWGSKLRHGGALAFELGENQSDYVSDLMKSQGFENIRTSLDLGGVQRAIIGTMP